MAAYRFLGNPKVRWSALLAPHFERTAQRCRVQPVVLAVSDTTSLNYSKRSATRGLGPIRTRRDKTYGLWVHSLMAFTPGGAALGLLDVQCWARDPAQFGSRHRRHQRATAQKETRKWLQSLATLEAVAVNGSATQYVMVADREADLYDLFAANAAGVSALLVRARHDRNLAQEQGKLFAVLAQSPAMGQIGITVPRREGQPARPATLAVRFVETELVSPTAPTQRPKVRVWAIEARELQPPAAVEAVHWRLLSTLAVGTLAEAVEKLQWYCVRWGIEVFHRVWKKDCAVEAAQLRSAAGLQRWLALKMVIAWRVMALMRLGREQPSAPLAQLMDEEEWVLLQLYVRERLRGHVRRLPEVVLAPTIADGIGWLGRLGGHLGRKGDGPPGPQSLARGLERLQAVRYGWRLAHEQQRCV